MKITVLLATIGKPTLARTLASFKDQAWQEGDEILVASDDNHVQVVNMCNAAGVPWSHVLLGGGPHKDWGHTPRNVAMPHAKGNFICHFDDDDVALPTMLRDMHAALDKDRDCVHLFRMLRYKKQDKIWLKEGVLRRRFVSTQNILHPNVPGTFGVWARFYGGDFFFIRDTCTKVGKVLWHDQVTCVYAPSPLMNLDQVLAWYTQVSG